MSDQPKGQQTVSEAGRLGGQQTAATHNHAFYVENGRRGGQATVAKHGPAQMARAGKKGGAVRAAQVAAGKRAEEQDR